MGTKLRSDVVSGTNCESTRAGTGLDAVQDLRSRAVLQEGVVSVAGAAKFSLAAAHDMLDGKITPQEATVLNTTAGRVLKAAELYLKHARGTNTKLEIPELMEDRK